MAKATNKKPAAAKAPRAPAAPKVEAPQAAPDAPPAPEFSYGLAEPGGDVPDGARRFSCPDCGAKHDVVRNAADTKGQGGTWVVSNFTCVAGCGYTAAVQPVN